MADGDVSNSDPEGHVFGIDLGTSNSCVALWVNGSVNIVHNQQGDRTTPSVLAIEADDTITVGAPARRQAVMNPTSTISEVKRLVGLRFDSPQVTAARGVLPYEICSATNGDAWTSVCGKKYSPVELQAFILEELAAASSKFIGRGAKRVVITVPAFFDETQRQAVRDAAKIAGLVVERILSEPTAAALAYGYAQFDNRHIAVVDLGGGTLDVTVMKVDQGKFEVLGTDGDNALGGADFDRTLAQHFAADILLKHGVDVSCDPVAMQRLIGDAEVAKRELTQRNTCDISLPYLTQSEKGPVNFEFQLTQELYETLVADLVERIAAPCREAVSLAGLRPSQLDDVILVGGMTRSPVVQAKVKELFQRKPLLRINPDEAVAMGAALLGAGISGKLDEVSFVDVAPRSIGLRAAGDRFVPLIKKSTTLPARCRKGFKTTRDDQRSFELDIFQGESPKASENRSLAHVTVDPITRKPAGEVVLEVTFEVDAHGALVVLAKERGENSPITVAVEPTSGLTSSQVEHLAATHAQKRPEVLESGGDLEAEMGGFGISIGKAKKTAGKAVAAKAPAPAQHSTKPKSSRPLTADDLFADEPSVEEDMAVPSQSIAMPDASRASSEEAPAAGASSSTERSSSQDDADDGSGVGTKLVIGVAVAVAVGCAVAAITLLS
ncbi:MAG: Hsp70 family protein [Myxococcales bacterium]|nr:Hsp70 family protein [Myxococcales bacterium]